MSSAFDHRSQLIRDHNHSDSALKLMVNSSGYSLLKHTGAT